VGKRNKKYLESELIALAAPYKSRTEFKAAHGGAYNSTRVQGLLDSVCGHMALRLRSFTSAEVAEIASGYSSRSAFARSNIKEHRKAYDNAYRYGLIDEVCSHMGDRKQVESKYSVQELRNAAEMFENSSQFRLGDPARHKAAYKQGLFDEFYPVKACRRLTDRQLAVIAAGFKTRGDFKAADAGAYKAALTRGLLDSVCAHMTPGMTGFKPHKPAILYYLKVSRPSGKPLYKIGITNRTLKLRFVPADLQKIEVLLTKRFSLGKDAWEKERLIKQENKQYKYKGKKVLRDGNTELFTTDILGMDK